MRLDKNCVHYLRRPCQYAANICLAHPKQPANLLLTLDYHEVDCTRCRNLMNELGLRPLEEYPTVPTLDVQLKRVWSHADQNRESLVVRCPVCGDEEEYALDQAGKEVDCKCECFTRIVLRPTGELWRSPKWGQYRTDAATTGEAAI